MLSLASFIRLARDWIELGSQHSFFANWRLEVISEQQSACMRKRITRVHSKEVTSPGQQIPRSGDGCLLQDYANVQRVHILDVTIAFSATYKVPVLYFNILDTSGLPIPANNLDLYMGQTYISEKKASSSCIEPVVTLVEHPFDECLAFMVHPCATASQMRNICQSSNNKAYLFQWWSLYGRLLDLSLPVECICDLLSSSNSRHKVPLNEQGAPSRISQ